MQSTNANAPVRCKKQIEINAPVEKVWNIIADIDHWALWQPDITKPRLLGPLKEGTKFKWRTGGAGITSTLQVIDKPTHFGWTGKTYGMYAIHNWTLQKTAMGTLVIVDETMQGLLASIFKKSFNRNLERDMGNWLGYLKAKAEQQD